MKIFQKSKHFVFKAIAKMLPNHIKRVILWSTLYGKICMQRKIPSENTSNLNRVMGLAMNDDATLLPIKMGDIIWSDLDKCSDAVVSAVEGCGLDECAGRFASGIPRFLKYASEHYIVEDFKRLVLAHQQHTPAVA